MEPLSPLRMGRIAQSAETTYDAHTPPTSLVAARIGHVLLIAPVTGGAKVTEDIATQGISATRPARWV
jgi:hypothetical protein